MKNYQKIQTKFVEDIHSEVTVYRHVKTGARICTIANDDSNKVFCIAFRTPAINSTGLTHILEHSVLCGSKKYPVKDPFLEMVKGSVNTFLNAFTFPDKTCYPFASQNDKDFKNLMSVYTDAVFYPMIYQEEKIFHQEGWRYELFNKKDPIVINGVVYNEMKGAFSNPDETLFRDTFQALFPDTSYSFESGGVPAVIPDLSYEEFVNFHKKYYSASNAFIYIYGNCDMEERLNWLDQEYLSKMDKVDFDTEVKKQPVFKEMAIKEDLYPIGENEPLENKTNFSLGFALDDGKDRELNVAVALLDDVLVNDPGAKLKKAILDAKIGDSVEVGFEDGLVQPLNVMFIKDGNPENKDKLLQVYKDTINSILKEGLNHQAIASHLNNIEFKLRENKFGYNPQGLDYILKSLDTWLYDDDMVADNLESLKYFPKLRQDLENGYFEKVLKDVFLNSARAALVVLKPSKEIQAKNDKALADKLRTYKDSLTDGQIDKLIAQSEDLRKYQQEPSSPEALATLPRLAKDDLIDKPIPFNSILDKTLVFDIYRQKYVTNEIGYCGYYFDISGMPNQYLPYISLLGSLYTEMATAKHSEGELNSELLSHAGSVSFGTVGFNDMKAEGKLHQFFYAKFSVLEKEIGYVGQLIEEILFTTKFEDYDKLYEQICSIKNNLLGSASYSGHRIAVMRSLAHVDAVGYYQDTMEGLGFIDFICSLAANFQKEKENIVAMLKKTAGIILSQKRFMGYYTGEDAGYELFKKTAADFQGKLPKGIKPEGKFVFVPVKGSEAIRAPYDVVFDAKAAPYEKLGGVYSGDIRTLLNAVVNDWLWMKIRVKGGAYGSFIVIKRKGEMAVASYRDPNIKSTLETFDGIPAFAENMKYSDQELLTFKIGAYAELHPVLHVSALGERAFSNNISGVTYEQLTKEQDELLNATLESMKSHIPALKKSLEAASFVVFGSEKLIDQNKEMFTSIRNLMK